MGDHRDEQLGRRLLRLASGLRARTDAASRTTGPARPVARQPSPRHRNVAVPARVALPSDVVGVAAVFGVSLGVVLISVVLGLVGPSWLVAMTMLVCGAALAVFLAARKYTLHATAAERFSSATQPADRNAKGRRLLAEPPAFGV